MPIVQHPDTKEQGHYITVTWSATFKSKVFVPLDVLVADRAADIDPEYDEKSIVPGAFNIIKVERDPADAGEFCSCGEFYERRDIAGGRCTKCGTMIV